jgi:hypothetical protein
MAKRMLLLWAGPTQGAGGGGPGGFSATLASLFASPLEIGAQLINPTFSAAYSPSGTELFAELSDDDGNPAQNVLGLPNPLTMPFTYQESANNTVRTWTLTANDGGPNVTDQVTATWSPRVYWGLNASPSLSTEGDIEGLANSALQSDKALSTSFTPVNEYIYYGFPTAYAASPLDFQFGAFPGGFIQVVASVAVTANTPGAPVQTYQLWRSQFAQNSPLQPFTVAA